MAESLFYTLARIPLGLLRPSHLNLYHQSGEYKGTILSQEGVRQGDILSSFIFSLSMQPAYEKIDDILAGRYFGPTKDLDTPSDSQPPPLPLLKPDPSDTDTIPPAQERHPSLSCAYI
jgi:hypothetical protein